MLSEISRKLSLSLSRSRTVFCMTACIFVSTGRSIFRPHPSIAYPTPRTVFLASMVLSGVLSHFWAATRRSSILLGELAASGDVSGLAEVQVPEPGALVLLVLGVFDLAGIGRRRRG